MSEEDEPYWTTPDHRDAGGRAEGFAVLNRLADAVLAYKPKPKSAPAKKRKRRKAKIEREHDHV